MNNLKRCQQAFDYSLPPEYWSDDGEEFDTDRLYDADEDGKDYYTPPPLTTNCSECGLPIRGNERLCRQCKEVAGEF